MREYERKTLADLKDVQGRILEIFYGEPNKRRSSRLYKWVVQTTHLLDEERQYAFRSQTAREAWAKRKVA